jgi:hypothetical protein
MTDVDATTAITLAIAAARKQTIMAGSRLPAIQDNVTKPTLFIVSE